MDKKSLSRKVLGEKINAWLENNTLADDAFFLCAIRATANNSLQLEVMQNRNLSSGAITLLGALNQSDDRFGTVGTMVYDWIKATPKDLIKIFPDLPFNLADLEAIADTWTEDAPQGIDANVYPILMSTDKMIINGKEHKPIIVVTEVTETALKNGEFFTESGANQQERIDAALKNNLMKVSSKEDADYIVEESTGDRIARFVRTEAVDPRGNDDKLIKGKVSESVYKSRLAKRGANNAAKSSLSSILTDKEGVLAS